MPANATALPADSVSDAHVIASIGASLASPKGVDAAAGFDGVPYALVPPGYSFRSLEDTLPWPARKRGRDTLNDADSFVRFVNENKTGATRLYGTLTPPSVLAVFDDHGDEPGWRQHTALYACPLSAEWKTWNAADGRRMQQAEFAQFVEDNAPDCVTPPAADMIEIARTLEAKKKVNFASGIRLTNGQTELTYEETVQGTAAKGRLALPEVFTLGVPVLEGGPKYALEARLRYRIGDGGALAMWFDLVRPHKLIEHAAREVWGLIEAQTDLRIFNGSPGAA